MTTMRKRQFDLQRGRPTESRLLMLLFLVGAFALGMAAAGNAEAVTPVIPFDAPALVHKGIGYGFLDPQSHGLAVDDYMYWDNQDFQEVVPPGQLNTSGGAALLFLDRQTTIDVCATEGGEFCSGEFHIFEAVWDITLNPLFFAGSPAQQVNLLLVDSDPAEVYDANSVGIYYDSLTVNGQSFGFGVTEYCQFQLDCENPELHDSLTLFHFLDADLGAMVGGEAGTTRVTFRYQVTGLLGLNPDFDNMALLAPPILAAARATVVPEPSTALMLGLGLVGFSIRSNVRARKKRRENKPLSEIA